MREQERILRFPEISEITGLSRSTIQRLERVGKFPHRKNLSSRVVGFLMSEVEKWMRNN